MSVAKGVERGDIMRKSITEFAKAMENKLKKHDDDYGESGWLKPTCNISFLIERLSQERIEAVNAYKDCDPEDLKAECVDVANFAMMIYDRIQSRSDAENERLRSL